MVGRKRKMLLRNTTNVWVRAIERIIVMIIIMAIGRWKMKKMHPPPPKPKHAKHFGVNTRDVS